MGQMHTFFRGLLCLLVHSKKEIAASKKAPDHLITFLLFGERFVFLKRRGKKKKRVRCVNLQSAQYVSYLSRSLVVAQMKGTKRYPKVSELQRNAMEWVRNGIKPRTSGEEQSIRVASIGSLRQQPHTNRSEKQQRRAWRHLLPSPRLRIDKHGAC